MSLYSEVAEIEHHLHSNERWLEVAASPSGETNCADPVGTTPASVKAFRIDAGNSAWGAWTQIVGSGDTPVDAGNVYFDFHRLVINATERANVYFIQIGFGTVSAGVLTGEYSEIVFSPVGTNGEQAVINIQNKAYPVGTKVWARCLCPGQNTATLDFYIGLHEYPVFTEATLGEVTLAASQPNLTGTGIAKENTLQSMISSTRLVKWIKNYLSSNSRIIVDKTIKK